MMGTDTRLLGDVGGTNARFAWQDRAGAALTDIATLRCADHPSLRAAIERYLRDHGKPAPRAAAIGIANPVLGDAVRMTNHPWSFSIAQLRAELGLERLEVLNDFTALALALPALAPADLRAIGGGAAVADAAIALIGPGTGLGVSGLLPAADGRAWVPVRGEGGHVSLAADDEREVAIVQWLVQRFGHASAERALSGPGLCNLYGAVCALNRVDALPLQPAEVVARARAGNDAASAEALALFCAWLGSVAGDLALTLGARGGVYLGGGIVPRIADVIAASRFRERFVAKGRFRPYLEAIPTWLIDARTPPALLGAARALEPRG